MARRKSQFIELDGPVFDPEVQTVVAGAINKGIADLANEGEGILLGFIHVAGFVKTGEFAGGVDSEMHTRPNEPGYSKLGVLTGAWPEKGRPPREWLVTGRRNGIKLRKGNGVFAKTATRLKDFSAETFEGHLTEALN